MPAHMRRTYYGASALSRQRRWACVQGMMSREAQLGVQGVQGVSLPRHHELAQHFYKHVRPERPVPIEL